MDSRARKRVSLIRGPPEAHVGGTRAGANSMHLKGVIADTLANLKFRTPGVSKNFPVKVFPLGSLSPLLTAMKELGWIAWYSHINILKIDTWSFFLLSLLCYKGNPLGNVNFSRKIQEA